MYPDIQAIIINAEKTRLVRSLLEKSDRHNRWLLCNYASIESSSTSKRNCKTEYTGDRANVECMKSSRRRNEP